MNVIISLKKMIKLKQAETTEDLALIQQLSHEIWHEYYPAIVSVTQIDYMLNKFHSIEALQNQIDAGQKFFLIMDGNKVIGYCAFSEKNGAAFLHKFYILSSSRGNGIGGEVFKQILDLLTDNKKISLQVNRRNFKSVNFYFKQGFSIEYVKDFDIGVGYTMDDFVMTKILS